MTAGRTITPSDNNPWSAGQTDQPNGIQRQKAAAMAAQIRRNRDIMHGRQIELPELYGVSLQLEPRAGDNFIPRFATIICPVITASKRADRILVIAPDGTDQWVDWKTA